MSSALVYREVCTTPPENQRDWRREELQDESGYSASSTNYGPSCGGGYAYSHYSPNRFIIWRYHQGDIDLMEYSLDQALIGNALRLHIGCDVVPDLMFHEAIAEKSFLVIVMILYQRTEERSSLRRLVFPHPNSISSEAPAQHPASKSSQFVQPSIFSIRNSNFEDTKIGSNVLSDGKEKPVVCCLASEKHIFVGCQSGSLIHIELGAIGKVETYFETVLRPSAPILSTLKGLIPVLGKKNQAKIVGVQQLSFWDGSVFVFSLSEDAKLRGWILDWGSLKLVLETDVKIESWALENKPIINKLSLRKLDPTNNDKSQFYLAVYVGLSGDSHVQLYRGNYFSESRKVELDIAGISFNHNDLNIDFQLSYGDFALNDISDELIEDTSKPRVWCLWKGKGDKEEGRYTLKHSKFLGGDHSVHALEVNLWKQTHLVSPNDGLDGLLNLDFGGIDEHFLNGILEPYKFSQRILLRSLVNFTSKRDEQVHFPHRIDSMEELKTLITNEIRNQSMTSFKFWAANSPIMNETLASSVTPSRPTTPISPLISNQLEGNEATRKQMLAVRELRRITISTWTQYVKYCIAAWEEEHSPLAVFCPPFTGGLTVVVKAGQVSFMRECSPLESLSLMTIGGRSYNQFTSQLYKLLDVMQIITTQIGATQLETFDRRLFQLVDPITSASYDIELLTGGIMDMIPFSSRSGLIAANHTTNIISTKGSSASRRSFLNRFTRACHSLTNIDECVTSLLGFIEHRLNANENKGAQQETDDEVKESDWPYLGTLCLQSDIMDEVLSHTFQQIVSVHFSRLRDCLYFVLLCIKCQLHLRLSPACVDNLYSLLPSISHQLKTHHVLKWISRQFASIDILNEASMASSLRRSAPSHIQSFDQLKCSYENSPLTLLQVYIKDVKSQLRQLILSHKGCIRVLESRGWDRESSWRNWRSVETIAECLIELLNPNSVLGDDASFSNVMLFRGQTWALQEYIRLLDTKNSYHRDILGECYLANAQYEKAIECFTQASINYEYEMKLANSMHQEAGNQQHDSSRKHQFANFVLSDSSSHPLCISLQQSLGREKYESEGHSLFYWKALIPKLAVRNFSDLVVRSATAALSCVQEDDQETFNMLYSHIFSHSLALGYHEKAYLAMIQMKAEPQKLDALSQLLITLVESKKQNELKTIPFVGLQQHVHNMLLSHARAQDISIDNGANYFQVLYSFHIHMLNYKEAAETMFIYADRLATEYQLDVSYMERYANALLAVLTTLKLLPPQHAYILKRKHSNSSSVASSITSSPNPKKRGFDLSEDGEMEIDSNKVKASGAGYQNISGSISSKPTHSSDYDQLSNIYTLEKIEQLYLLAQANIMMARMNKSISLAGALRSPQTTLQLLISESLFEMAYRVSHTFKLSLDDIFARQTLACLRSSGSSRSHDNMTEMERWKPLRLALAQYDTIESNFHYHFVVADTLLKYNREISLPVWLIYTLKGGKILQVSDFLNYGQHRESQRINNNISMSDSSDQMVTSAEHYSDNDVEENDKSSQLLLLYLKYGLIEDAAKLSLEVIRRCSKRLQALINPHELFQNRLPIELVEQALGRLAGPPSPSVDSIALSKSYLCKELEKSLNGYLDLVKAKNLLVSGPRK